MIDVWARGGHVWRVEYERRTADGPGQMPKDWATVDRDTLERLLSEAGYTQTGVEET